MTSKITTADIGLDNTSYVIDQLLHHDSKIEKSYKNGRKIKCLTDHAATDDQIDPNLPIRVLITADNNSEYVGLPGLKFADNEVLIKGGKTTFPKNYKIISPKDYPIQSIENSLLELAVTKLSPNYSR